MCCRHSAERTPHGVGVSGGVRRWLKTKSSSTLKSSLSGIKLDAPGKQDAKLSRFRDHRSGTCTPNLNLNRSGVNRSRKSGANLGIKNQTGQEPESEIQRVIAKLLKPSVDTDEETEYHSYVFCFDYTDHLWEMNVHLHIFKLSMTTEILMVYSNQSYLHQFDDLCLDSASAREDIYDADLRVYEKTVALSSRCDDHHHQMPLIEVDTKSRMMYQEAVMIATTSGRLERVANMIDHLV